MFYLVSIGAQRRKRARRFRHHQLIVLIRDVSLDLAVRNQIRDQTMRLIDRHVVLACEYQCVEELLQIDLMCLQQQINLLEQTPIRDDFQLLNDDVDSRVDEKRLIFLHCCIERSNVSLLQCARKLIELRHIKLLHRLLSWHMSEQHLHRHEIDEHKINVFPALSRAVLKCERETFLRRLIVGIVHRFAANKVLIGDLLCQRKAVLERE